MDSILNQRSAQVLLRVYLVPLVGLLLLFIRRTALEDRFLLAELEGYAEFAQKVRYRLLPGIW